MIQINIQFYQSIKIHVEQYVNIWILSIVLFQSYSFIIVSWHDDLLIRFELFIKFKIDFIQDLKFYILQYLTNLNHMQQKDFRLI